MTDKTEPAYPQMKLFNGDGPPFYDYTGGLTKREYFAAMAMQGMIASNPGIQIKYPEKMAKIAVNYADHLIEELNK